MNKICLRFWQRIISCLCLQIFWWTFDVIIDDSIFDVVKGLTLSRKLKLFLKIKTKIHLNLINIIVWHFLLDMHIFLKIIIGKKIVFYELPPHPWFIISTRVCVRNLDLRVHIVLKASKSGGAKGDVPKICRFFHPLHPC